LNHQELGLELCDSNFWQPQWTNDSPNGCNFTS
jgi:hypothetical protein